MVKCTWPKTSSLLWIVVLLACSGCGRKTMPIPPSAVIPLAVTDLRYHQEENRILFSWTYPNETTIGTEIKSLQGFQVFRSVVPEAQYCETCPISFRLHKEIDFQEANVDTEKRKAQFEELVLRPGYHYFYKVRVQAGWRLISGDSNILSFHWDAPVEAVKDLQIEPGDKELRLSWKSALLRTDGTPAPEPLQYQILRSFNGADFQSVSRGIKSTNFRDIGLANGQRYFYKVRAVFQGEENATYGLASSPVSEVPIDRKAPVPPNNLTVSHVQDSVELTWVPGQEEDVAGYRVYRKTEIANKWEIIGETRQTRYIDLKLPGKKQLIYSVTAFDRAQPANESLFAKEVIYESF